MFDSLTEEYDIHLARFLRPPGSRILHVCRALHSVVHAYLLSPILKIHYFMLSNVEYDTTTLVGS